MSMMAIEIVSFPIKTDDLNHNDINFTRGYSIAYKNRSQELVLFGALRSLNRNLKPCPWAVSNPFFKDSARC